MHVTQIGIGMERLNTLLKDDLTKPIRFGLGIHGGKVVVGDIGYRGHFVFTALGDAVNVSARLQDMTKDLKCEVVVSDEIRRAAGVEADVLPATLVSLRGRSAPVSVCSIERAIDAPRVA